MFIKEKRVWDADTYLEKTRHGTLYSNFVGDGMRYYFDIWVDHELILLRLG